MAASYGGTLIDGVAGGEDTFVIRVPQSRARMLAVDPHVKSIAPMRFTAAPQTVVETVPWSSGVSYSYDGTGNIRQIGNDVFAYDGVSRLAQATVNSVHRTYQYDVYGNRTACTQFGPNDCQAFTINTAENKNRIAGAEYDKNDPAGAGNVTGLSGHVYSYDPLNMMTRDTYGTLAREFVYTADDERIATYTVFGSSWSWTVRGTDEKVLREFTSNDGPAGPGTSGWQWTKDYVWRDGLLLASRQPDGANTATYHYHLDHLGTPRRVTDQNDIIVGVHDYLAFGPETSGGTAERSATKLKYTGHERDSWSSGSSEDLDYMHARYYSPYLGRFLSVDPELDIKEAVREPQTWNRYEYARNNPVTYLDADGKQAAPGQYYVNGQGWTNTSPLERRLTPAQERRMVGQFVKLTVAAVGLAVGAPLLEGGGVALAARFPRLFMWAMQIGGAMTGGPSVNLGSGARPIAGSINVDNLSPGFRGTMQQVQVAGDALALPFKNGSIGNVTAQNFPSVLLGQGGQQLAGELSRTMQSGSTLTVTTQTPGALQAFGELLKGFKDIVIKDNMLTAIHR
jgi:RHS repeat-associated protein